ncbi:hypothetical protein [Thalassoglobus sp.]|uniref:hypothetical protein n=1 Tax=Thalassoglobus sp. TaxID=2795869 RepID=UPI003AA7FFCF
MCLRSCFRKALYGTTLLQIYSLHFEVYLFVVYDSDKFCFLAVVKANRKWHRKVSTQFGVAIVNARLPKVGNVEEGLRGGESIPSGYNRTGLLPPDCLH